MKCSCLHGNTTGVVYLFVFNNWEIFISGGFSSFLPWKSSPKVQGEKDFFFFFSLKFLLWQKWYSPSRSGISAQSHGSALWCPRSSRHLQMISSSPIWDSFREPGPALRLLLLWALPGSLPQIPGVGLGSVIWHWPPERHTETHYHLLTQLLFSFLRTGICTVFNANRGNTFIALSKKFWCYKVMFRKSEQLNPSASAGPALLMLLGWENILKVSS